MEHAYPSGTPADRLGPELPAVWAQVNGRGARLERLHRTSHAPILVGPAQLRVLMLRLRSRSYSAVVRLGR